MKPRHAILLALVITPHIIHAAPSKLLDALRWEESRNRKHVVNTNRNGTKDYGPYQLNSAYLDDFRWRYNGGKVIDPFDLKKSRFIANAHLDHMQRALLTGSSDCGMTNYLGRWEGVLQAWNCGLTRYRRGAPRVSIDFAKRVMKRAGMGIK